MILVALYVDNLIFSSNNDEMIEEFKSTMTREFEMTNLGLLKFFLGLEVKQEEMDMFYITGDICKGDLEEVQDEKLQPDINLNGTRSKTLKVWRRRTSRCK